MIPKARARVYYEIEEMQYRQKTLLAVIETFGGKLNNTDLQKLVFIFCQQAKRSYYDFFPHKFGGYSFLVDQDKKKLVELGALTEIDDIRLKPGLSFYSQLESFDQLTLKSMKQQMNSLRGRTLIHKAYLDYPRYTCRSTILPQILNPAELEIVKTQWNNDKSACLFTIGYEGLSVDAYLGKLILNNIAVLIDVRKNPFSHKPGFSKAQLENYTKVIGVVYCHIPELGIPSDLRQKLISPDDYAQLFTHYEKEILPEQMESIKKVKDLLEKNHRAALTCFEADYHFCHRHKITEYLQREKDFKTRIQHL